MSRERVEYALRAISFLLTENREAFCEILPTWGSSVFHTTRNLKKPMEILTSIYAQNAGLPTVRPHRNVATACFPCRLPRFPTSRLNFGKRVASRVTKSHLVCILDLPKLSADGDCPVSAPDVMRDSVNKCHCSQPFRLPAAQPSKFSPEANVYRSSPEIDCEAGSSHILAISKLGNVITTSHRHGTESRRSAL